MKKLLVFCLIFAILISNLTAFAAYDIDYGSIINSPELKELVKSQITRNEKLLYPETEHPYLLVNDEFIDMLKKEKNSTNYATAYSYQLDLATRPLPAQPEGGILSVAISDQLNARAFMYVMGEVDKKHARETVAYAIEYIKNAKTAKTYSIDIYKDFGNQAIMCGAFVYDWCYDVMKTSQKIELAEAIYKHMNDPVQHCRPDNVSSWSDINGYAVGQPLIYNSFATVALYDIYPDMYEDIMGKVLGSMAEISKIYGEAGALTDASTAYSREYYTYHVELMFQRMGHDISEIYGKQLPVGYRLMYGRVPYGGFLKTGDTFGFIDYNYGAYIHSVDTGYDMGLLQVMFEDPYLKHFHERNSYSNRGLLNLLLYKSTHEADTPDDLPLAFEVYEPRSEIIHKTSWQEGLDSPQVTAYMNMNNRRSGDHDHAELGSFQIYYKGPLSMPGGQYYGTGWGKGHWKNYLTRSVSKNVMLLRDPSEVFKYGTNPTEANDGGQKMVANKNGGLVIEKTAEHMSDFNLWAITEGSYIGPNEMTPAFSYIKGDLTRAYSENKMASYKRSMVFMDTFNETYPGVMVVFDKMVSKKADFPKTWLLQAVAEPHIEGNKITIINTESEPKANGKLVNFTLYPEDITIESVGGIADYVSDGQSWNDTDPVSACTIYQSGYRAEVKPVKSQEEDIFLNAMYIADGDTKAPDLEMKKLEDDNFLGVATLDRQVMFAKSGNNIAEQFSINVANNGSEKMLVLVGDVAVGKWSVEGNGTSIIVESKETDSCIVFEAKPGTYTIKPVDAEKDVTEVEWPQMPKELIGDYAIRVGSVYQYMRDPNKLVNGVPYFSDKFINNSTYAKAVRDGNNLIITSPDGKTIKLTAGVNEYTVTIPSGTTTIPLKDAPFIDENGIFYLSFGDKLGENIGGTFTYVDSGKVLIVKLTEYSSSSKVGVLSGVDESKVLAPISMDCSTDDGNVIKNINDRDLSTRWSSQQGDGEWARFEMGTEPVAMSAVQIAWYNGDKRNWKFDIQISNDGENWTTILESQKSAGKSVEVETFKLPEGTKAKYIRYLGHGEEVTKSFYNSVTEFLVLK